MTVFAAPALPALALRRSWLMSRVADLAAGQQALALLRRLAPARARGLGPTAGVAVFKALLTETEHRFPLNIWDVESFAEEGDTLADLWAGGIPVAVDGWHPEDSSPALALGVVTLSGMFGLDSPREVYGLVEDNLDDWVMTWWGGQSAPAKAAHARQRAYVPRPPRGRDWIKPWDGLPDLARYCQAGTGSLFLDTDVESASAGPNPAWTLGEIRALEREWQRAKPMAARIHTLVDFIEAKPRERLRDLYEALRETPGSLQLITRPKPGTLARAFGRRKP